MIPVDDAIIISLSYSITATASGALLVIRDTIKTVNRDTSHNYVIPNTFIPGVLPVFAYDIEPKGILSTGVHYPAIATFALTEIIKSKTYVHMCTYVDEYNFSWEGQKHTVYAGC